MTDNEGEIKGERFNWRGHLEKINKLVDTLYKGKSKGRRKLGKIKVSWLKKIMNDLKKLKVEIEKAPDEND